MSTLAPFLDLLKKTSATEVRLAPGEAARVVAAGRTEDVGARLEAKSILLAAGEVLSQDELRDLPSQRPRTVRHEHDGDAYVLEIQRDGANVTIAIRPGARPAPRTRAIPPIAPPSAAAPTAAAAPAAGSIPTPAPEPKRRHSKQVRSTRASQRPPQEVPPVEIVLAEGKPPPRDTSAVDALLREMIAKGASDLHLSAGVRPMIRASGDMCGLEGRPPLSGGDVFDLVRSIVTDKAERDFAELRDADFAYEVKGLARFRVNVFEDRNGVGAVFRQIPIDIISADKLGLPKACLDLCNLTKGLVVVTGPTGSGKSTTLAAMIDHVNRTRTDHIITIEDPVEFVHPNIKCLVNQREVGQHTKSFKNALRAALREDPDIVLVGEMRDLETIAIAIETAETGHLVFGTLHTTTAVSTVDRIIDQFPSDRQAQIRVMLSESLKGVIAQVLCKKIGGGRVAAHEILLGTSAVSALVRDGKTFQMASVMQTSRGAGMITMNDSLLALVQKKLVEPKEAWMKAVDKAGLLSSFKSAGLPTTFA